MPAAKPVALEPSYVTVPLSVSIEVMLTVSLPRSCKLPLLTSVFAVKFLPLISKVAPLLIVSVLATLPALLPTNDTSPAILAIVTL